MEIQKRENAPRYTRDGTESFLLVSKRTGGSENLSVTLVEMEPGGEQKIHRHDPEQMYYILEGSGMMSVDGEEREIAAGECVYFRSNAFHGLRNTGSVKLRYLSAASPGFSAQLCDEWWPLPPLSKMKSVEWSQ